MLCVIDVGNTHTVVGLFNGDVLLECFRLRTNESMTPDEWGVTFKTLFSLREIAFDAVSNAAISSVVPPATTAVDRACRKYFGVTPLIVGPGVKTGLPIRYENPREVGADRVVNAVAGYQRVKQACIVVDFGTATTFDCISSKGEYLGGVITPGIVTSLDALASRTAKLPRVEVGKPRHPIGRNTVESIQSGVLYGYVAMVDGLIKRLKMEMGGEVRVIATGGLSSTIADESESIDEVCPDLTLDGLRLVFNMNRSD
jgi:type III pantothenate kinase